MLTSAEAVRLRIQDRATMIDRTLQGDGTAATFAIPFINQTSGQAYVPAAGGWSATGATFNPSGYVTFSGVISALSAFRVAYVCSVFSDDEIDHFLSVGGNVDGAALEAIETLMFDSLKRLQWSSPDGTSVNDTAAQSQLQAMYDRLLVKINAAAEADAAGMVSWAEVQGDY